MLAFGSENTGWPLPLVFQRGFNGLAWLWAGPTTSFKPSAVVNADHRVVVACRPFSSCDADRRLAAPPAGFPTYG